MADNLLILLVIALLLYPALQCANGLVWLFERRRSAGRSKKARHS